jgi:hypothetical protein
MRPAREGQSQNHRTLTDGQENGIMATIDREFLSQYRKLSSHAFKGLVVHVWSARLTLLLRPKISNAARAIASNGHSEEERPNS